LHCLSVEDAIRLALEEKARAAGIAMDARHPRDQSPEAVAARHARTDRFVAELAAMPVLDPRSPRDIMDDPDSMAVTLRQSFPTRGHHAWTENAGTQFSVRARTD
jgi:antitoxin VapB